MDALPPTHAYFLLDAAALHDSSAVARVVTRMLVYLASQHESLSWNYEVVDMRMRQRALTAHGKRRVAERRQLAPDSLRDFEDALAGRKASQQQRAVLATLHERLMCLEADVEWGDPALMRSPTRAARTWADPTRLNESMSVRSFLYIVGEPPETPEGVDAFVCGSAPGAGPEGASLLEKLIRLRDGIIGNGIWESYARKRVGVSWIRPSKPTALYGSPRPVDTLIGAVFACCFEALGGCVMSVPELDTADWPPFSSLFAPLHRVRAYPGWSRKFAREMSAVADYFARDSAMDVQGRLPRRAWAIQAAGGSSIEDASIVVEREYSHRQWLADGRLQRRYDFSELVELAYTVRLVKLQSATQARSNAPRLEYIHNIPLRIWPRISRYLPCEPVLCCCVESGDFGFFHDSAIIAQPPATSPEQQGVVIVPVGGSRMVAVYPADAASLSRVLLALEPVAEKGLDGTADNCAEAVERFSQAWLESWGLNAQLPPLDVAPLSTCAIDVSISTSLMDSYRLRLEKPCSKATPVPEDQSEHACPTSSSPARLPDLAQVVTLDAWYTELYLKMLPRRDPQFSQLMDVLRHLFDHSEDAGVSLDDMIASVLRGSASIEDVFDRPASTDCASGGDSYAALRAQSASAIAGNLPDQRLWQLQECQIQILLHLLVIDRIHTHSAAADKDTAQQEESLSDLVDQLCIWASVDDVFCSTAAANPEGEGSGDLATTFIGSSLVGQFAERLGGIVEELRMQCGWVPSDGQATANGLPPSDNELGGKRRKGTPRKINSAPAERSEVIVQQSKRRPQAMSGRKLARHLEDLIGGKKNKRAHGQDTGPTGDPSAVLPRSQRPNQLRLPQQLIRQLKSEVVVSTARPASLSRARTMGGRRNGSSTFRRTNTLGGEYDTANNARRGSRGSGRPAIPEFGNLGSSPSLSGQVKSLQLMGETPTVKRQRTGEAALASSPPVPIPSTVPAASTFIYDSDESEGAVERCSPLFSRMGVHDQPPFRDSGSADVNATSTIFDQNSRRVLRFSGGGRN
ncbi:hypothetical protein GGF46_002709 [Coemansia sp. RSA 552]|nr:hypothetical protein GGF46_002709 [Coemansia sp. RSA 552]